jgi:hypothetical protein
MLIDVRQTAGDRSRGSLEGIIAGHHLDGILASTTSQTLPNEIRILKVPSLHAKDVGSQLQQLTNLVGERPGIGSGQTQAG